MLDIRKVTGRKTRGRMMYFFSFLPDEAYIQLFFFACNWRFLDLKNPKTFCEKLNWMKLHDRHPEYSKFADKLAAREYIKENLGEEYVFPIYGYWKSFDEIDFSQLPDSFVLKCNHDSGSVKVIKDKNKLSERDYKELKNFFNHRLKHDAFYSGREYPYKGIERFIFAEKFMQSRKSNLESFEDYKFMCFNGKPKLLYIETERSVSVKMNFFDMDFNPIDDIIGDKPKAKHQFEKPPCFEEMKAIAERLSQGITFVRIDFRVVDDQIYFGEYTFYDNGGFREFKPKDWDQKLASWIDIDSLKNAGKEK